QNEEGTKVSIYGQLTLIQNSKNLNLGFSWDTKSHSNWDEYPNRKEADNYGGLQTFSLNISNLNRTTKYYYRAWGEYKLQKNQIRQGEEKTFIPGGPTVSTHTATNIGLTSAVIRGVLWHMGGAATCEVFFEYGTDEQHLDMETPHQTLNSNTDFSATITNLTICTTYYFRAIAINDADTTVGAIFSVIPGQPYVVTNLPTDVGTTSALFRGELTFLGGASTCDVWFEYDDIDQYPPFDKNTTPQTLNAPGSFDANVENLTPGTTYWVRAVAYNGYCTDEGEVESFTTLSGLEDILIGKSSDLTNKQTDAEITSTTTTKPVLTQILDRLKNLDNETIKELAEHYPVIKLLISFYLK
ncbi:MAG: hypothetical protein JSW60_08620, partial [Thermoplasmatales archaeon]